MPTDRVLLFALFFRKIEVETILEFRKRHAAAQLVAAVREFDEVWIFVVEFVAQRTHDLLERVLAKREPDRRTVLIEHDGALLAMLLQLAEKIRDRHGVGHEDGRAGDRAQIGRFSAERRVEHILRMHDPDDRIEPEFAQGEPRVPAGPDVLEVLLERVPR